MLNKVQELRELNKALKNCGKMKDDAILFQLHLRSFNAYNNNRKRT